MSVPVAEEGFDFGKQDLALLVPLGRAAQDHGAFALRGQVTACLRRLMGTAGCNALPL